MCGRFYIDSEMWEEIQTIAGEIDRRLCAVPQRRDIFPSQEPPVLRTQAGKSILTSMRWGFPGAGSRLLINARAESVLEHPMFRDSFLSRRLVIPAAGFYEWSPEKEKAEFTRPGAGAMFMAGFYNLFEGENRFIILTVPANASVAPVHHRMPLLLEPDALETWLQSAPDAERMLKRTMPQLARVQEYEQQNLFSLLQ